MTYAIIETGGKQLRVEPGRFYDIELLPIEPEQTINIETVLLVQHNGAVTIGQPFIGGAAVEGTVMRHLRGRKVLVYKMKPKKKTRKKRGHRQEITRLMINSISLNGLVLTSAETEELAAPPSDQPAVAAEIPEKAAEELVATPSDQPAVVETAAEPVATSEAEELVTTPSEVVETPAEELAATPSDQPAVVETAAEPADEQQ